MNVPIMVLCREDKGFYANIFNGAGPADWTKLDNGDRCGTGTSLSLLLQALVSEPANVISNVTFTLTESATTTTAPTRTPLPVRVTLSCAVGSYAQPRRRGTTDIDS